MNRRYGSLARVIARYEQHIAELERERLVLAEKLEAKAAPSKRFADVFELTLSALASSCSVWENGTLGRRHALLKVAIEDRLVYCRNEGFRTPNTSMIFSMLGQFCGPKAGLAEGMSAQCLGFPQLTRRIPASTHHDTHHRASDRRGRAWTL